MREYPAITGKDAIKFIKKIRKNREIRDTLVRKLKKQ